MKSFLTIKDMLVEILDAVVQKSHGTAVYIPGGVKVTMEDSAARMLQRANGNPDHFAVKHKLDVCVFKIEDPIYPPIHYGMSFRDAAACLQPFDGEFGPRANRRIVRCTHSPESPVVGCEYCLKRSFENVGKDEPTE